MAHFHGTIVSSLAISFASRVVQKATQRPRQLMDEPSPCSMRRFVQMPAPGGRLHRNCRLVKFQATDEKELSHRNIRPRTQAGTDASQV